VNQFVASRILHAMGPSYVIVENGKEAVAAFAQQDFHVVLMHGSALPGTTDDGRRAAALKEEYCCRVGTNVISTLYC